MPEYNLAQGGAGMFILGVVGMAVAYLASGVTMWFAGAAALAAAGFLLVAFIDEEPGPSEVEDDYDL